ncbi:MAG: holo-ACP synthase [Leptospiraceae bacterium]|nr:holo-ACP synthase [Leptospiraceae bacterium]NUM42677.1 holo-ACP synthase [Leptospiraceae bacterium]
MRLSRSLQKAKNRKLVLEKISVGNDIVDNARIRTLLKKFGDRFLHRIFSESEIEYCMQKADPVPFLSGRFACKEAFIKAIQLDKHEVLDLREIELFGRDSGKKKLVIHGRSKEMFHNKGFDSISVSISHVKEYSTAIVVLYRG